jgi:SAM-dependent MidA family methyltransferase
MSERAAAAVRAAIAERGPITFAEFMEHALYGPGGFYEQPPISAEGHFVTSPHVHPVFADLVRIALTQAHEALGRPEPLRVVELGAGDGTLARGILVGLEAAGIAVRYTAVEVSPGAREHLRRLPVAVAASLAEVEPLDPGIVLANELLDNLPFRRVRRRSGVLVEVRVGLAEDRFVEVETACDPELAALVPAGLPEGEEAVVPTGALALVGSLARTLVRGYALLIDYGSPHGPAGEVHGYRGHAVLEDVLAEPGSMDVTAGVDLGLVAARAEELGLRAHGIVSQWRALLALGYERWAAGERERQAELLAARRGLEAVRAWEGRSRASLLVDPAALGRLRWLLLSTPGLPSPPWLVEALAADRATAR